MFSLTEAKSFIYFTKSSSIRPYSKDLKYFHVRARKKNKTINAKIVLVYFKL